MKPTNVLIGTMKTMKSETIQTFAHEITYEIL